MNEGVRYKLDFFVGFHAGEASRRFPMALFLSDQPNAIPFGIGDPNFGCPTNGPGWDLMGELMVTGNNNWVRVEFEFTPTKEYSYMVLGPGCEIHPDFALHPYFFMDRLVLAELGEFSIPTSIYGDICDDQLLIEALPDQIGYQWYFEGEAIIGETENLLELNFDSPEGTYVAVIDTEDGCYLSSEYFLTFPPSESYDTITICEGETFLFGDQSLTDEGTYDELFTVGSLCDSLVYMTVKVEPNTEGVFEQTFCTGEIVEHEGEEFTSGGQYEIRLKNRFGCDSLLEVNLIEVDTAVEYYTTLEICEGESISFGSYIDVTDQGIYDERFAIDTGCDSLSLVEIIVNRDSEALIYDTICPGFSVEIASKIYDTPGEFQTIIDNENGCDSIVNITITEVPGVELLSVEDTIHIELGESFDLIPLVGDNVVRAEWTEQDSFLSDEKDLIGLTPWNNTRYELTGYTEYDCLQSRSVVVEVDREIRIYIPNVISQQENRPDDRFLFGANKAVKDIERLRIYDRWGELVYTYEGTLEDYKGWQGLFNGKYVEQGVYTYMVEFVLVDETKEMRVGDLTYLN